MTTAGDLQRQLELRRLAAQLGKLDRKVDGISRSNQMARRSIYAAGLPVIDADGVVKAVIGIQEDGTAGVVAVNGAPPPQPTNPVMLGGIGCVQVSWDGQWENANRAPLDFRRVQVHLSPNAGFEPTVDTLAGSIETPLGGVLTLTVTGYAAQYARLVAENTSAVTGAPSGQASAVAELVDGPDIKAGAITAGKIRAGAIDASKLTSGLFGQNLIPDAGFELPTGSAWVTGTTTGQHVATIGHADRASLIGAVPRTGRGCAILRCDPTPSGSWVESPAFPVMAGLTYRNAFHADGVNGPVIVARVFTAPDAGGPWTEAVAYPALSIDPGWDQYVLPAFTPPASSSWAKVRYEAPQSTAVGGRVLLDDCVFTLLGFGAAELTGAGLRLYDQDGDVSVDLSSTGTNGNYVTIQNDGMAVAAIGSDGAGSFTTLDADSDITIGGRPLLGGFRDFEAPSDHPPDGIIDRLPRGVVAFGITGGGTATGGPNVERGIMELAFNAEANRSYRVEVSDHLLTASAAGWAGVRVRNGGPNTPHLQSPVLGYSYATSTTAGFFATRFSKVLRCNNSGSVSVGGELNAGENRLLLSLVGSSNITSYASNRWEVTVTDVGMDMPNTAVSRIELNSTTNPLGTSSPTARLRVGTWAATWSGTYDATTKQYLSARASTLVQGFYSTATNGNMRAMVGFPTAVASTLTGALIRKVEVYLYFNYWYYSTGGTAVIGAHGQVARPTTFSTSGAPVLSAKWPKPAGRWVALPEAWWASFKSGAYRGITLGPGPTASHTYHGRADGYNGARPPQLRVTYVK